jgi:sugar lactone lactonase YvrE
MRLNGGVIGRANEPTEAKAEGVWGWPEQQTNTLHGSFPSTTGFSIFTQYPTFVSNTGVLINSETSPNGIAFKPDGTLMYMVGSNNDTVYQFSLSTPWDSTTLTYSNISFSVSEQELTPQGLAFKPDGSKMYIVGSSGDDVNEYALSESWNVATASYVQVFSVAAQELTPQGLAFKPDGSKMYIVGSSGDDVNEYALSESWNVATASYVQVFSVAAQEPSPTDIAFKPDGTLMYIVGSSNDNVSQYYLSNAWNVASAVYSSFYYIGTQDSAPTGIAFSENGDRFYVVGTTGDDLNEYNVPNPWDFSTPPTVNFSVSSQDTNPRGLYFKPDGSKMYVATSTRDNVYQYSLSVPWDISSASYDSKNYYVFITGVLETPSSLSFSPTGNLMFVTGTAPVSGATISLVRQYTLSTLWDVSTASFSAQTTPISSTTFQLTSHYIDSSGEKLFVASNTGNVRYYKLLTPWDVSSATLISSYNIYPDISLTGLYFNDEGTRLYTVSTSDVVREYILRTPWDLGTLQYTFTSLNMDSLRETNPIGVYYNSNNKQLYITGTATTNIFQFDLG